jgi:hypothetical protein
MERSEVYDLRETVISKGQVPGASPIQFITSGQAPYSSPPRGKPHTVYYLGANPIQFTTSGKALYSLLPRGKPHIGKFASACIALFL